MKKLVVMAMALCSFSIGCHREDTKAAAVWRTVEPRLTAATKWQPCTRPQCGAGPSASIASTCTVDIRTHEQALYAIAHQPECLGSAIDVLSRLAKHDLRARSDLAAAYYVRAQVEDRPIYLLMAWEQIKDLPGLPEAQFNVALIQEKLGRTEDARRSWDAYRARDVSPWGNEARQHGDRLNEELRHAAYKEWPVNRRLLRAALAGQDHARVVSLIRAFPTPAQTYLEDEVIPQWAASGAQKDLDAARLLAEAVSEVQQDPFARDVVAAITNASDRSVLRNAHKAYARARRAERGFDRKNALARYDRAVTLLTRGHSPLRFNAELGLAVNRFLEKKGRPEGALERLKREIPSIYPHTAARVMATVAFAQNFSGNHLGAREQYERATNAYRRLHDYEYMTAVQSAASGVSLELGDKERAWHEALETNEHAAEIADPRRRHVRLGALSDAAQALGHPDVALLYQSEAVEAMQQELVNEPVQNLDVIQGLQHHLSVALRNRAKVRLALDPEQREKASADLRDALGLVETKEDADTQNSRDLRSSIYTVEGSQLLRADPQGAVKAFTKAIELLPENELPNLRTSLLTRRARAFRLAKHPKEAEADLEAALAELDREEAIQLENRRSGKEEEIWSLFFERFQDTYRELIDLLAARGQYEQAFAYAERAKAFEPLDLILHLPYAPQRFRELTKGREPIALHEIQAALPAETYLLEYSVLEDRTIVWIIGRRLSRWMSLPVGRNEIASWRARIQEAVEQSDDHGLKSNLALAYDGLLQEPWKLIPKTASREPRIVIIPDGEMRGLPFNALRHPIRGYFVEHAIVSVHGSATLYVFSLLRDGELKTGNASALLIGDPEFDATLREARELLRLRGARNEVNNISQFYAPNATVRKDKDATIADFLQRAVHSEIIHIAAHGVVDEEHPSRSAILLARTATDSGRLDAQTLSGLRLKLARLVVLASCSSAGGVPVGPEGVAPLVRPFIGAGVPAVVGSLWEFADATAEPLLVSFHRHYREPGQDAATALRAAQLEALDENKPLRAWAPFEVIGYASSPVPAPAAGTKEKRPP
ncbi:MAG TPA: CHAT domain-containing protein [Thermoanaerobaculia bacterium]|jgi:CHAT domain-containing protein|nr:CHAT domain-containing protein [Thermoanaerobaculia bacterium]